MRYQIFYITLHYITLHYVTPWHQSVYITIQCRPYTLLQMTMPAMHRRSRVTKMRRKTSAGFLLRQLCLRKVLMLQADRLAEVFVHFLGWGRFDIG